MTLETKLSKHITTFLQKKHAVEVESFEFQLTRKEFEGDLTLVVFPLLKHIKTNPVQLGEQIGEYLTESTTDVSKFNVVKGFLNLSLAESYFTGLINDIRQDKDFGFKKVTPESQKVMVEYSSPNTNKPLHLGHVRNNLLGYSVAEIQKAAGKQVYKTQIINDRGIHICKSMVAWQKFGDGETPKTSGVKGDHLVGKYYVEFDKAYKKEINDLINQGKTEEEAKKEAPIFLEAQAMLKKWEAGDSKVVELWKTMNQWVYDGFEITYDNLGVDFDKNYYESETYLLGKDHIKAGIESGVFFKKEDGSVWIDLSDEGLDEKIVLRSDGTAVYMTQDIGTAIQRVADYDIDEMVFTVGNEQDYHFKVLFLILKKLGFEWADHLFHLSYGMVDLPSGKMKSREGNVVDADDLIEEMTSTAKTISQELGKLEGYDEKERNELYNMIGLGALKYYILKVDPKKRILFDPQESVDFQGNTGPFIQYTYARIQSILRKANQEVTTLDLSNYQFDLKEKALIKIINQFPDIIQQAAEHYSPALVANYVYDLVKEFNSFYQNVSILGADEAQQIEFRVELARLVGEVIQKSFKVLGIDVPQRM
ncbi:arginine--tRNA ligase [Psychroflexus montanilacus]|uniref:arginine--tRNA ligase n=1 Tax=Psychroflexus montanilacus TaxID=2873598 RepID=UPI001CC91652|nr:arginine--tRNA ligase [Psychroflexus montanilacus]MBZ9652928.1 arginine--tRNA ligase [Psychroflexus montanilacus]